MQFKWWVLLWVFVSGAVQAAGYSGSGDTTGAALWNRPVEDYTDLSLIATDVPYAVLAFQVDTAGSYSFNASAGYDNFTFLYQGSFSAADPLQHVIAANDDNGGLGASGFDASLLAGVDYYFIHTGFENTDAGLYQLTINGAGNVLVAASPVPAPAAVWLFATGLPLMAAAIRRRRQA